MDSGHLLWRYANCDDLLAVQRLFSEGKASPFDVNSRGSTALTYVTGHTNPQLCRFLIQQGTDPDLVSEIGTTGAELLWEAAFAGTYGPESTSIVGSILADSDYVETRRFSILHKIILGLINKDLKSELEISTASINNGDSRGRTPLCWATIRDDLLAVDTLLAFGADPNVADNLNQSPLHFVKNVGIGKLLLDAGADVNARTADHDRSALHQLCHGTGNIELVDLLIDAGIDVNVQDSDNETPLLNAIFWGLTSTAQRLIELGADVNACNHSSRNSAIHFAVCFDRFDIVSTAVGTRRRLQFRKCSW